MGMIKKTKKFFHREKLSYYEGFEKMEDIKELLNEMNRYQF